MSVISRGVLEESPLADLHELASELSIDGYRRLRREALTDAILTRQGAEVTALGTADADLDDDAAGEEGERGSRRRRSRRGSGRSGGVSETAVGPQSDVETEEEAEARRNAGRSGGRGEGSRRDGGRREERAGRDERPGRDAGVRREEGRRSEGGREGEREEDELVQGTVELLPNGSGFVRLNPPETSDGDVYISAAQVKRCELISGDVVAGPRRAPRRSERFASMVRIDSVNGRPAGEIADGIRYDELPAEFPTQRFAFGSEDPTLKAIEFLTPFGRGSRVTVVGPAYSGKSATLRLLLGALSGQDDLQVSVALVGARPEEISELSASATAPAAVAPLGASAEALAGAAELVVDQGRRAAARGAHAVVLIDSLDGVEPAAARRLLGAARNLRDGGSLTIIAAAAAPVGGETTVIALDRALTSQRRFPALDLAAGGTLWPERLVGEDAAAEIARAVSQTLGA